MHACMYACMHVCFSVRVAKVTRLMGHNCYGIATCVHESMLSCLLTCARKHACIINKAKTLSHTSIYGTSTTARNIYRLAAAPRSFRLASFRLPNTWSANRSLWNIIWWSVLAFHEWVLRGHAERLCCAIPGQKSRRGSTKKTYVHMHAWTENLAFTDPVSFVFSQFMYKYTT